MVWLDRLLSHTALVKAKNKQLQQYSDHISHLEELLHDYRDECIELNQIINNNSEITKGIDYEEIAKRKAKLCNEFFSQLNEEQQKNKELKRQVNDLETKYSNVNNELIMELARREGEILSLKHMLDRYEEGLDKLIKE